MRLPGYEASSIATGEEPIICESIVQGIRDTNLPDGNYTFRVKGNIDGTEETKDYDVELINYYEDMTYSLGEGQTSKIIALGDGTTEYKMLVVKYHKNLNIGEGVTLTANTVNELTYKKGMYICVLGDIYNNGTISMTARGTYNQAGENVYLWKNTDNSFEYVPAVGGSGGIGAGNWETSTLNGSIGEKRATGGGGAGGAAGTNPYPGGNGGSGTSYSGGSGGGGSYHSGARGSYAPSAGSSIGGPGGYGAARADDANASASGGAGNTSGVGAYAAPYNNSAKANADTYAQNGTGGLLIIYADNIINEGSITSKGSSVYGKKYTENLERYASGGASGGGSINIFYNNDCYSNFTDVTGGSTTPGYVTYDMEGGVGGAGSVTFTKVRPYLNYPQKSLELNINDTYSIDSEKLEYVRDEEQMEILYVGNVEYEILDTDVATIDNNGKITAIKKGETKVKITDTTNGYETYITVIVKTGTIEYIYNIDDLVAFRDSVNAGDNYEGKTVYVMKDIDMSEACSETVGSWTPIGGTSWKTTDVTETYFAGTFDGNYHKIINLYINDTEHQVQGLFTKNYGIIQNLVMENIHAYTEYKEYEQVSIYTGGIAGDNYGKIINVGINSGEFIAKKIIKSDKFATIFLGGITGDNYGSIINSYNRSNLSAIDETNKVQCLVGGITGYSPVTETYEMKLSNCYNTGKVNASGLYAVAGGISGCCDVNSSNYIIENVYNIGKVTSSAADTTMRFSNGIIGRVGYDDSNTSSNMKIVNSYYGTEAEYLYSYYTSSGYRNNTTGKISPTEDLKTYAATLGSAYENDDFNINNGYPILWWQAPTIDLSITQEYIKIGQELKINLIQRETIKEVFGRKLQVSDFTWTSSNEDVAEVNANGVVTGIGVGQATITAYNEEFGLELKAIINVYTENDVSSTALESVKVNGEELENRDNVYTYYMQEKDGDNAHVEIKAPENNNATIEVEELEGVGYLEFDEKLLSKIIKITKKIKVTSEDKTHTKEYTLVLIIKTQIKGIITTENYMGEYTSTVKLYRRKRKEDEDYKDDDEGTDPISSEELITERETEKDGSYVLDIDEIGVYDVIIEKEGYLSYKVAQIEIKPGAIVEIEEYKLIAGDVAEDGEIEINDLVDMNRNVGVEITDENREEKAIYDLNEDGKIDLEDRKILKENYGKKAEKVKWVETTDLFGDIDEMVQTFLLENDVTTVSTFGDVDETVQTIETYALTSDISPLTSQNSPLTSPMACKYTITSEYGNRVHPITGETKLHSGIDIVGEHHTEILSVAEGTVIYAGTINGYGNCVEIKHIVNGETIYSFYAHLSRIDVKVGDKVTQGQVIGLEGGAETDPNHGTSTGHHLHFELRTDSGSGHSVNPNSYIEF